MKLVIEAIADYAVFSSYVQESLMPKLHHSDVVIWDDFKSHQVKAAKDAVQNAEVHLIRLPLWSPDLTPIKEMASKIKESSGATVARTTETLVAAIGSTVQQEIAGQDISGWFQSHTRTQRDRESF